jgi:hypothetical protein
MPQTTYSFLDTVLILSHPILPVPIVVTGEGAGSITVSMQEARTAHDVAADGSVMVSKIAGNNGTVAIDVQQTSIAHKELLSLFNQLVIAPPDQWAQAALTIRNVTDGTGHLCTGISPAKIPDKAYGKSGAHVTWSLMAADIQSITV